MLPVKLVRSQQGSGFPTGHLLRVIHHQANLICYVLWIMVFDKCTHLILPDNAAYLWQARSKHWEPTMDIVEQFVGQTETLIHICILIYRKANVGVESVLTEPGIWLLWNEDHFIS